MLKKIFETYKNIFVLNEYVVYVIKENKDIKELITIRARGNASAIIKASKRISDSNEYYYKAIPMNYKGNIISRLYAELNNTPSTVE